MDGCLLEVGRVLGADHDIAQLARPGDGLGAVDREGQHVGRRIDAAVVAIQLADPYGVDKLDGQVPVLDSARLQRRQRRGPQLARTLDLGHDAQEAAGGLRRARRSGVAAFAWSA